MSFGNLKQDNITVRNNNIILNDLQVVTINGQTPFVPGGTGSFSNITVESITGGTGSFSNITVDTLIGHTGTFDNLTVNGTLDASNLTVANSIIAGLDITAGRNLFVTNNATIGHDTSIGHDLTIAGNLELGTSVNHDSYPVGKSHAYVYCTGDISLTIPHNDSIKFYSIGIINELTFSLATGIFMLTKTGVYQISIFAHSFHGTTMQLNLFIDGVDQGQPFSACSLTTDDICQSYIMQLNAGQSLELRSLNADLSDVVLGPAISGAGAGNCWASMCIQRFQ